MKCRDNLLVACSNATAITEFHAAAANSFGERDAARHRAPAPNFAKRLPEDEISLASCDPLIFCTGPVPAQQLDPLIPWLMQKTGTKKFYLPSADYIWPHVMNKRVRELVERVVCHWR